MKWKIRLISLRKRQLKENLKKVKVKEEGN